ncbi:MAG TPA: tetratricopeptide repeat protein [Sphingomicrobium sp.]|nr:tetratricopeptide repeat protein [Sphingomicrobium sp.]
MAQPPDISETFLREVDENLRRDRLRDFVRDYGSWIIVGLILFLAASGGFIWWQQHQRSQAEGQVEEISVVYKDIGAGKVSQAAKQLDELAGSGSKAVRASALFAKAALALQQNDHKTAIATYRQIAGEGGLPQSYRDAAVIRQTALEFDQIKPDEVISRMQPFAKPGNAWFGTAGEMTALAMIKQGKKAEAGRLFAAVAKDKTVPESIRARAVQIAGSLGIDASSALDSLAQ